MIDEVAIDAWFSCEVLPLEPALKRYIRRNWRNSQDISDLLHDVYTLAICSVRNGLPHHTPAYVFTITRNHLAQRRKKERIVLLEFVTDTEALGPEIDIFAADRFMTARDELRHAQAGLNNLPPRCREVVYLRKVEGLTTRETAERLGVGIDAIEQQLTKGMRALTDFMLGAPGRIMPSGHARRAERNAHE